MTQRQMVLEILKEGKGITSMQAFDLGITRLAAIIFVLRERGYPIRTESIETVNRYGETTRYARYTLEEQPC